VVEKKFSEIEENSYLPICSLSVRNKKDVSLICLLAGKKILQNLSLLPEPYSYFIKNGHKNDHIISLNLSESKMNFGYLFIQIPSFIPRDDTISFLSLMCPLQEDEIKKIGIHVSSDSLNLMFRSKLSINAA
jgi:hypothetical protein